MTKKKKQEVKQEAGFLYYIGKDGYVWREPCSEKETITWRGSA